MINSFVSMLNEGANLTCTYDAFGEVNQYILSNEGKTTTVPKGNSNFQKISHYISSNDIYIEPELKWVEIIRNVDNEILHFLTNIGAFTDSEENSVSKYLKKLINNKQIEIKETSNIPYIERVEVSVFLPRMYKLSNTLHECINESPIASSALGLEFEVNPRLIQNVEDDFFNGYEFVRSNLDYTKGLVFRFDVTKSNAKKLFNWSKGALGNEVEELEKSLLEELALYKRSRSRGPRTCWFFDFTTLQNYLWAPIFQFSNRVINMVNMQADNKSMPLMSKERVGDMACIKFYYSDGHNTIQSISKLLDSQISIFPEQLNWDYNPTDIVFKRISFLYNQGLYFESLIVTQSFLESLVSGMYDKNIINQVLNRDVIKWEQRYKYLNDFFDNQLSEDSHLKYLFNGGFKEIYDYRNSYAHDYLEHRPDYTFDIELYKKVNLLVKPFIENYEGTKFVREITGIYNQKREFWEYLLSLKKDRVRYPVLSFFKKLIKLKGFFKKL
ncbi:hypothetical protein GCM10008107_13160 [Psychrosphaera saromensis]|uniref:Apea-like HEPN domain-containing protein n=1 Tax=Psychrosphaera saromensis TaxID=716813 RepID=A0A2S7UV91_9GAMM|nr:hypothetical protein [Psychrosphaera saromensis]PQJ53442.1 hypothetical protein BTO11_07010 [Psychrosphaera saromensis]GHB65505.1 hypothetical protein GCM10008107_13160 [Psychrosphaera saromensis]GLQ14772.1 hypothetical protein GCM10007917_22270 [Psychrosphaera saromensis]